MLTMDLPKIDTSNLWDKTYTILKEKIIHREFQANQKLYIPELSQQLGVSRTPIRDALNRLEMDGLVKTVSKVGTFVNAIEAEDVMDIMDTRLMLEFWVVDKLGAVPPDELPVKLQGMEQVVAQSLQELETLPLDEYLQRDYNLAFHLEFMKLGGNAKNIGIYKNLMNYRFLAAKNSLISKEMVVSAINQHQRIIEAIKTGDVGRMKEVIRKHLEDSRTGLIEKINRNGGVI
ncbi:GntR family transcriptional regulator [Cohnella xylanilytica]|nr:GntR family transcriptional regulator [Cohnella xylanilytica]